MPGELCRHDIARFRLSPPLAAALQVLVVAKWSQRRCEACVGTQTPGARGGLPGDHRTYGTTTDVHRCRRLRPPWRRTSGLGGGKLFDAHEGG
jgi:hypothetical protein